MKAQAVAKQLRNRFELSAQAVDRMNSTANLTDTNKTAEQKRTTITCRRKQRRRGKQKTTVIKQNTFSQVWRDGLDKDIRLPDQFSEVTVQRIPAEIFKEALELRNEMSDEGILRFDMDQPVIFMWGSGDRSDVGKVIGITDVTYTIDCIGENYIVNKTHPAFLPMIAGRFVVHWRVPRNISKGFSASEDRQLQVGVEVKQITIVPLACLKGKKGWRRGIEGGGRGEGGRALWNFEFFRK